MALTQETLAPELTPSQHSHEAGALALQALQDSEVARPHGEDLMDYTWYHPSGHLEWRQPSEREMVHTGAYALQLQEKKLRVESRAVRADFTEGDVARAIVGMRRLDRREVASGSDFGDIVDVLKKHIRTFAPDRFELDDDDSDEVVVQKVHNTIRYTEDYVWYLGQERQATYQKEAIEVENSWVRADERMSDRRDDDTGEFDVRDTVTKADKITSKYSRRRAELELQAKNQGLDERIVEAFLPAEAMMGPKPELTESDKLVIDRALQHSIEDIFESVLAKHEQEGVNMQLAPSLFTPQQLAEIERFHEARQWMRDSIAEVYPHPLFVAYHTTEHEVEESASRGNMQAAEVADVKDVNTGDATTGTKFRRIVRQLVNPNVMVGTPTVSKDRPAKRRHTNVG